MRQPPDPPAGRAAKPQLSVLITGDVSFGESYQLREEGRGNENVLKSRGYAYTLEKLSGLLLKSDLVLGNFESTIAGDLVSPFTTKRFINWSDSRETPKQLLAHNIKTVSLANNHTIDYGDAGLLQTVQVLESAGIQVIGAGKNLEDARRPFSYEIDLQSPTGLIRRQKIKAFAAFAVDEKYQREFKAYAGAANPGTNPLLVEELAAAIAAEKHREPDTFVIALAHWRRDYKWRSKAQLAAAHAIMKAGADLMMSHGAHMLQEIEKVANHWVCHGLGNFAYNSPGFYESRKAPPFSLVCRLIFSSESSSPRCLLYPLFTNNRVTRYQTRFVNDMEFKEVVRLIREKTNDRAGFDLEIGTGKDEFGHFIEMPVGRGRRQTKKRAATLSRRRVVRDASFELVTHTYKGPNIHARHAAVRCEVTVDKSRLLNSERRARGIRRLLRLLPELDGMFPAQAGDVSWLNEAMLNKVLLAEISAAVTFALMRRIDEWISPVSSRLLEDNSGFYLVCEYRRSANNAKAAVKLALELVEYAGRSTHDKEEPRQKLADFVQTRRWRHAVNTVHLVEEAEDRGIPVSPSIAGPFTLGQGCFQRRLRQTMTSKTSYLAVRMAKDKVQATSVLRQAGVPVPEQISVGSKKNAIAAAKRIGYPVVIKPSVGNMGRGVSVKLMSEAAVGDAYDEAAAIGKPVVVESYITGFDHRLLVVDGELVAACQRVPGHVVGNGVDSIKRLLEILNSDPRRDGRFMHKIKFDFDARRMLEEQGLMLDSVPENGKIVFLRSKANTSAGGTSLGLTERVHPDNRLLAIAAAQALQLDVAGIDLITTDISRSYKETKGAVCEVNNSPGIMDLHVNPGSGSAIMVAPYILDMLFPPPSTGRIPIIAICGDHFDDRLSHCIAHLLQIAGHEVGLATHKGVWVGGNLIAEVDSANADGARRVLLHPIVSAAVVEVSTEAMLAEGLGFDFADTAVITNTFPGRLSRAQAKEAATLIRSVVGSLILDDDTPHAEELATAAREDGVQIVEKRQAQAVLEASGRSIESRIELAVAACLAVGISPTAVEGALKADTDTEESDPLLIGGLSTPSGEILLATPRNGAELRTIIRIAQSWANSQSPDIVVHMAFKGEPDLAAALDTLLKTGFARLFGTDSDASSDADLSAHVFTGADRRAVILTDNMPYVRRRLRRAVPT